MRWAFSFFFHYLWCCCRCFLDSPRNDWWKRECTAPIGPSHISMEHICQQLAPPKSQHQTRLSLYPTQPWFQMISNGKLCSQVPMRSLTMDWNKNNPEVCESDKNSCFHGRRKSCLFRRLSHNFNSKSSSAAFNWVRIRLTRRFLVAVDESSSEESSEESSESSSEESSESSITESISSSRCSFAAR
jgi:hypothetical protein